MGRGGKRHPARVRSLRPYLIGLAARAEFRAAIAYVAEESSQGARTVVDAVDRKIKQLRRYPESAPEDDQAPIVAGGAQRRKTHAAGLTIRYLYPIAMSGRSDGVLILSIRRSERLPIGDAEFVARYAAEQLRLRTGRHRPPEVSPGR